MSRPPGPRRLAAPITNDSPAAADPEAAVRIVLLGPPRVEADGGRRRLPGHKPWALLTILLLESAGSTRRELAERIWPAADNPLGAVRWALLQVRRAIAPARVDEVDGRLRIANRAALAVDADVVLAGRLEASDADRIVGGDLLEGFAFDGAPNLEQWLALQRARVRSASAEGLRWAATVLSDADPERAISLAERAAQLDPFDDAVHELIVYCHVRRGDRRAARDHVERTTRLYRAELDEDAPLSIARPLERPSTIDRDDVSLSTADPSLTGGLEAATLLELARMRLESGDYDSAVELGRRAVAAAAAGRDGALEGRATLDLATTLIHSVRGRDREAHGLVRRALQLATALGDRGMAADAEREIGYLHFLEADYGAAEAALERAIRIATLDGNQVALGRALTILGACRSDRADYASAEPTLRLAVDRLIEVGDERWRAYALSFIARVELRTGRVEQALLTATASIAAARASGWLSLVPWPMAILGEAQLLGADIRLASATFGQAYLLAREIGDPCWQAVALRGMALVAQQDGDPDRARGLLAQGLRCAREQPDTYTWATAALLTDLVGLEGGASRAHLAEAIRIVTRGPMADLARRVLDAASSQTLDQTVDP